ncbi:hypothetical protein ACOME3_010530 [Neoechinorhynchus agilis]
MENHYDLEAIKNEYDQLVVETKGQSKEFLEYRSRIKTFHSCPKKNVNPAYAAKNGWKLINPSAAAAELIECTDCGAVQSLDLVAKNPKVVLRQLRICSPLKPS